MVERNRHGAKEKANGKEKGREGGMKRDSLQASFLMCNA